MIVGATRVGVLLVARCGLLCAALGALACSTGEGEGYVHSERLYVTDCWNGKFDLDPTFFGANPYRDTLLIRVQHGDNIQEVSDGVSIQVLDVPGIRSSGLHQELRVGLPPAVVPPGHAVVVNPDPPKVTLTLYLHDTCHGANGALYSIEGSINFQALFSGDPSESNADDRLTDAHFHAQFADTREADVDGVYPDGHVSEVDGSFHFFFQRGQPAQPFP